MPACESALQDSAPPVPIPGALQISLPPHSNCPFPGLGQPDRLARQRVRCMTLVTEPADPARRCSGWVQADRRRSVGAATALAKVDPTAIGVDLE